MQRIYEGMGVLHGGFSHMFGVDVVDALRLRLGGATLIAETAVKHMVWNPHVVKRVAIIGVHGWFPGRILSM